MNRSLDAYIRWTSRCNGWMWSVLRGAVLVAEGQEQSEALARAKANAFIAEAA